MSNLVSPSSLEDAQATINEIETGLENHSPLIYQMFSQKRDVIRHLGECYEILVKNNKIPDLETNQIAKHIMKKLSKLNVDVGRTWIYDSLPAKYKLHKLDFNLEQSIEWTRNSSLNTETPDYEQENKNEILLVEQEIKLLKTRIAKLKSSHYTSKLESESYREDYIIRMAAQRLLADVLDDRQTVPVNTIHLLMSAYEGATLNYAAGEYIASLKKFGAQKKDASITTLKKIFSSKQLTKILKGHVKTLHVSQEIRTQEEAYENGFYGKKGCDECGSWRVILEEHYDPNTGRYSNSRLYCFKCGKTTVPPKVKLPLSLATPRITQERVL